MRKSNFALRLQPSLLAEARTLAAAEGVALNQLINVAVAEKLAAARTERRLAGDAATSAPPPGRDAIVRLLRQRESEIRARGVTRLALIGSVARGDAGPASDVDLLVDIAPGRKFSLIDHSGLRLYFRDLLGRETDVLVRSGMTPKLRQRIDGDEKAVF